MSLTPNEAAQSLRDVTETEQRSTELHHYRNSAPFFWWWGSYWVLGYGATAFWPWEAWKIWSGLSVVAMLGHSLIVRHVHRDNPAAGRDWRWGAAGMIFWVFLIGTFAIVGFNGLKVGAFTPLLMGAAYAIAGLFFGIRFLVTGFAVMVATILGYFFLREYFAIWMAIVGGGALILTGFWMRKI